MIIEKSVCIDCKWTNSCQKIKKLCEMCNGEINGIGKNIDIFDVVITKCSLKNLDRSYKTTIKMKTTINMNKNEMKNGDIYNHCSGGMYYCTECLSMHHENSRIGKLHKKDE